jgi:SAM-dependent methyltransferase
MTVTPPGDYVAWQGWSKDAFGLYTREDEVYFRCELARCGVNTVAGLHVFELGFGNGTFAGWVRDNQGRWSGMEHLPELLSRARDCGFSVHSSEKALRSAVPSTSQDLVVAFDVIEHLSVKDIRTFLAEARRILKTQGCLIGRVPSGDSPFSGAIFRGDLTHQTLLGSKALRQLAYECEFEVDRILPTAFPVTGLGLRRTLRRAVVQIGRAATAVLVRNVWMADRHAVVTPNMTFVLRPARASIS